MSSKKIAGGAWGSIHDACCHGSSDCEYIAKWVSVASDDIQKFESEVKLQNIVGKSDATLPILFAWIDEDSKKGWFIMKRLHMDMRQYIKFNHIKILPDRIAEKVVDIFRKLRNQRIVHWDSHLGNFMMSTDGNVYIIDFGQSKQYSEIEWRRNVARGIYDLKMFIEDLRTNKIEINQVLKDELDEYISKHNINLADVPIMPSDQLKMWG